MAGEGHRRPTRPRPANHPGLPQRRQDPRGSSRETKPAYRPPGQLLPPALRRGPVPAASQPVQGADRARLPRKPLDFYRELTQRQPAPPEDRQSDTRDNPPEVVTRLADRLDRSSVLPRPVAPIARETLVSYLTRLADANRLTLAEVLAVLPSWFTTKINNRDDRAQHHMLAPATSQAMNSLARLAGTTPAGLAHALPAFGAADTNNPLRATTACHKCTARRGVHEPIPVHQPVHHKVCTRHGVWLGDPGLPHLDVTACPEIIT